MEAAVWLMVATGLDHQRRDLAERRMEATVVIQLVEMVARLMVETAALAEQVGLPWEETAVKEVASLNQQITSQSLVIVAVMAAMVAKPEMEDFRQAEMAA